MLLLSLCSTGHLQEPALVQTALSFRLFSVGSVMSHDYYGVLQIVLCVMLSHGNVRPGSRHLRRARRRRPWLRHAGGGHAPGPLLERSP